MRYLKLLSICLVVGACSSPDLVTSLDDLASDTDIQGSFGMVQARSLSMNGMAIPCNPGEAVRFTANRTPFTALGVSTIRSEDEQETRSFVSRHTYGGDINLETKIDAEGEHTILHLRDALLESRLLAAQYVRSVAAASLLRSQLDDAKETQPDPETNPDPDADGGQDSSEAASEIERLAASVEDASKAQFAAREKLDASVSAINAMIDRPGILIVRVASKGEKTLWGKFGEIFATSAEEKYEKFGFAVLAGLSYERLHVGSDIKQARGEVRKTWSLIGPRFPFILGVVGGDNWYSWVPILGQLDYDDLWAVTASLRAKYVLYAQDELTEKAIQAELETALKDLDSLGAKLTDEDKLLMKAAVKSVTQLGNAGILGPAAIQNEFCFDGDSHSLEENIDPLDPKSWQVVYQVGIDFWELKNYAGGNGIRFESGVGDFFRALTNW